eukprot:7986320-Prorocentrum_lima.AAC.1
MTARRYHIPPQVPGAHQIICPQLYHDYQHVQILQSRLGIPDDEDGISVECPEITVVDRSGKCQTDSATAEANG